MKVYNAIPTQFKPPPGSAQLQYVEAFDSEFTLLLCERKSVSFIDMMNYAVGVEVNLMSARRKKRDEGEWWREEGDQSKGKELEQPSTSYTQEARGDMMMRTMEKLMERLTMDNRPPPRDHQEQQNKNQNVRRPHILQNRARDHRNLPDHPVRPPFQQNYVEQDYEDQTREEIHHLDDELFPAFLTREDHDSSSRATESLQAIEAEGIHKGY